MIFPTDIVDPTLPRVPLKLGKVTYHLCFTFAALATAEQKLRELGEPVNILHALDFNDMGANRMVALLYAGLLTHQPGLTPEAAARLIKIPRIHAIREALFAAFVASFAEVDEDADPLDEPPAE